MKETEETQFIQKKTWEGKYKPISGISCLGKLHGTEEPYGHSL